MSLFLDSANAEIIKQQLKDLEQDKILKEYNIFIGEAKTIKQIKETMKKINVSVDTEHNLFIEHDYVKNGKILLIEDEDFKKQILIDKGIIKG